MSGLSSIEKARLAAEAALDTLARDPVALDVREVVSFADVLVLLSGGSDRQVRAIADAVAEALAVHGERPVGIEGLDEARWMLMDFADVIVHVFQQQARDHYDLERLWSDAPALELQEGGDRGVGTVGR